MKTVIKWTLILFTVLALPFIIAFVSLPRAYFLSKPECVNTLDNLNSATPDYQKELLRILASKQPEDFRYFFKTFVDEGGSSYMIVNFRNDSLCFDGKIKVDKWDKLAGMKQTNGVAYPHELYDLEWVIKESKDGSELNYVDMHFIID